MAKAIAVVSGDIHYNLNTMHIADKAVRQAIELANSLNVPFISNGDMLDQKALLRAEYVNLLIETFKLCKAKPYVNVGNHSRINEKSPEHALEFLRPYATIVDSPMYFSGIKSYIIPYFNNVVALRDYLEEIPEGSRLFMHQGLNGSDMGEYVKDHSALNPQDLANFRTILSHYHNRQDIKCGRPRKGAVGLATYIGSPYTITFSEANDLEKSIAIVYDDGLLEFVPTNLRKHVVIEMKPDGKAIPFTYKDGDIIKVKVSNTRENLRIFTKETVAKMLNLTGDFKLELVPLDSQSEAPKQAESLSQSDLLDSLIDSTTNVSDEQKARVKSLWKGML